MSKLEVNKIEIESINYNVSTVGDLSSINDLSINDTVVVTEEGRGGVFIYRVGGTSNGGTIFDSSSTGKWHRQHEGSVNVKWFGAIGDGVTDDTIAIQSAIDNIPDYVSSTEKVSYGGTVFFPHGTYNITDTIVINDKKGLCLNGAGKHTSTVVDASVSGGLTMFYINEEGSTGTDGHIVFESLGITSDRQLRPNSCGVNINTAPNITFRDCFFYGFTKLSALDAREVAGEFDPATITDGNYAIRFNFVVSSLIDNCDISWCGAGIVYDRYATVFNSVAKVTNSYINYCGYGMYLFGGAAPGLLVSGTTVEANYSPGIGIYNHENDINISASWFELNNNHIWVGRNASINVDGTGFYVSRPSNPLFVFDNPVTTYSNQHSFSQCIFNVSDTSNNTTIVNSNIRESKATGSGVLSYTRCSVANKNNSGTQINTTNGLTIDASTSVVNPIKAEWTTTSSGFKMMNLVNNANDSSVLAGNTLYKAEALNNQGDAVHGFSLWSNGAERGYFTTIGRAYLERISPTADNTHSIGTASARWSVIYAGTGTINTSDDREKTYLDITDVENQVAQELKANMRKFKFNDAIETKGIDNARIHFGASAQTVKSIFEKHGLVAEDYAILCYDEWDAEYEQVIDTPEKVSDNGDILQEVTYKNGTLIKEAGNRYGLRYEELLSFIIASI